jgi:hypothetical protein
MGRRDEAEDRLREAYEILRTAFGDDDSRTVRAREALVALPVG